jgi:hypothetical protein
MWRLAVGIAALIACKTDDAKRPPTTSAPPAPTETPPAPAPVPAPGPAPMPLDLAKARALEPRFEGATPLAPLRMHQRDQARQSWCIAGTDAEAIARGVAQQLTADGWDDVSSRGTAARAGASAAQGDVRISITIGGRDAACAGLVATAHYTGATLTLPALEAGERIH